MEPHSPESVSPASRPTSPEYSVSFAVHALSTNEFVTEPHYPEDLSDTAKVYLLDLEATFRGIKEEIRLTGKTEGYVVTDILMTIDDRRILPSEYQYLIHYAWYMCILNNINQQEPLQPRHIKQARHKRDILSEIRDQRPQIDFT